MHHDGLYILGLTGAIGSGKSSVAGLFRRAGIKVSCSDSHVATLYDNNPDFHVFLHRHFAACFDDHGALDKMRLRHYIFSNPPLRYALEGFLHPRVRAHHQSVIAKARKNGDRLVVLDVPLLFESGMETLCSGVLVTVCDERIRQSRVLARPSMSGELLALIEGAQMDPDEKKRRATFWVDTSVSRRQTWGSLRSQLTALCEGYRYDFA